MENRFTSVVYNQEAVASTEASLGERGHIPLSPFRILKGLSGNQYENGTSVRTISYYPSRTSTCDSKGLYRGISSNGEENRGISQHRNGRGICGRIVSFGLLVPSQIKYRPCSRTISSIHREANEIRSSKETKSNSQGYSHRGRSGETSCVLQKYTRKSSHLVTCIFGNPQSRTLFTSGSRLSSNKERSPNSMWQRTQGRTIGDSARMFGITTRISCGVSSEAGRLSLHNSSEGKSVFDFRCEKNGSCDSSPSRIQKESVSTPLQTFDDSEHDFKRGKYSLFAESTSTFSPRDNASLRKFHRLHRAKSVSKVRAELSLNSYEHVEPFTMNNGAYSRCII